MARRYPWGPGPQFNATSYGPRPVWSETSYGPGPFARGGVVAPTDYRGLSRPPGLGYSAEDLPTLPSTSVGTYGVGAGLIGVGGSALYGGAIGGISAKSWRGAGTGAIAGATASALSYGIFSAIGQNWAPAAVFGGIGVGGAVWTWMRWRGKKGRRQ